MEHGVMGLRLRRVLIEDRPADEKLAENWLKYAAIFRSVAIIDQLLKFRENPLLRHTFPDFHAKKGRVVVRQFRVRVQMQLRTVSFQHECGRGPPDVPGQADCVEGPSSICGKDRPQ